MFPSPNQPPDDLNRRPNKPHQPQDPSSNDVGAKSSPSAIRLTPEFLKSLSATELADVFLGALHNEESLNVFLDAATRLCDNQAADAKIFIENMCATLAANIKQHCGEDPMEARATLRPLLAASDVLVDAVTSNPALTKPTNLNGLMQVCIRVISGLDVHRGYLNELHALLDETSSPKAVVKDWQELYGLSFSQLLCCLDTPGFTPSAEVLSDCKKLLNIQLDWHRNGSGPLQSENSAEAEAWMRVLELAALLGDDTCEPDLIQIATHLIERNISDVDDTAVTGLDEPEVVEKLTTAGILDECEKRSIRALLKCQWSCGVEPVWEMVLSDYPLGSYAWRCGLTGLAKSDAAKAAPHLVRLLNALGSERCSPRKGNRLMKALEMFLDTPGAGDIFVEAFQQETEHQVKPEVQGRLLKRLDGRLARIRQASDNGSAKSNRVVAALEKVL